MRTEKPRFRPMSADEAYLRHSLLGALCGLCVGDALLQASIAQLPGVDANGAKNAPWFLCAGDVAFRMIRLDGRAVRLDPEEGPSMAILLDAADPWISAIEAALGLLLDTVDLGARAAHATIIAHVADGTGAFAMDIALPADVELLPMTAPFAPALLGHIPMPFRLSIDGPRLSPDDAAGLSPGDLLLIGGGVLAATLHPLGSGPIAGRLNPQDRLFQPR